MIDYDCSNLGLTAFEEVQCEHYQVFDQGVLYGTQSLNFALVAFIVLYVIMYKLVWCYCVRGFLNWRL